MAAAPRWRPMAAGDIDAVSRLSDAIHPGYPEDAAVLAERRRLYPAGCFVLERAGSPVGYGLTHPWRYARPPKLNTLLGAIPADADTYYVHDVALSAEARGGGAASALVDALVAHARGRFPTMSLVAVNGSAPFWARRGFVETTTPALGATLASYGPGTVFMARRLD